MWALCLAPFLTASNFVVVERFAVRFRVQERAGHRGLSWLQDKSKFSLNIPCLWNSLLFFQTAAPLHPENQEMFPCHPWYQRQPNTARGRGLCKPWGSLLGMCNLLCSSLQHLLWSTLPSTHSLRYYLAQAGHLIGETNRSVVLLFCLGDRFFLVLLQVDSVCPRLL